MVRVLRLTVVTGPHKGRRFCFCGASECQLGRAFDCLVDFAGARRDMLISRHHCRLELQPPVIRVHDLGSSNGTYINGQPVAGTAEAGDGDLITVGGTTLRVDMVDCPHAASECGAFGWDGAKVKKDCSLPCEPGKSCESEGAT